MTEIPVLAMDAETERKDALQRLSLRLEHHGHELIGRMQLLGLGPLIKYFGKDWGHLRDRVHESVRSILRSYSDQFIVSCPFDDESYVVFTTRGSQKEATHRCAEIGQRILHKLLGTEADTSLIEMLTWSLDDGGKPGFRRLWTIDSALHDGDTEDLDHPGEDLADIDWRAETHLRFRPMMSVKDKALEIFECIAVRRMACVGFVSGRDVLPQPDDLKAVAELDLFVLRSAIPELERMSAQGLRSTILLPIHFTTLTEETGIDYLIESRPLLKNVDPARLAFEIIGLPTRLTEFNYRDLVSALGSASRPVFARVPIEFQNFLDLRLAGIHGVGVDLYDDSRSEAQIIGMLDRFSMRASDENLVTYGFGTRTLSLNTAAMCSGLDFVGGYPVSPTCDAVTDVSEFDLRAVYKPVVNAA